MVIECTECHTRFKLADDKVKPGGTKVRCSKCKHIFTVMPPAPEPPQEEEIDFGEFNMERLPDSGSAATATPPAEAAAPPEWSTESHAPATAAADIDQSTPTAFPADGEAGPVSIPSEFSFGDEFGDAADESPASPPPAEDFSFDEAPAATGAAPFLPAEDDTASAPDSVGDAGAADTFAFDDGGEAADDFALGEPGESDLADDNFSFEESDEFSFAAETTTESSADEFSFDDDAATGSVEFDFGDESTGSGGNTDFAWETDSPVVDEGGFDFEQSESTTQKTDDFDFSGMTFGEEEAAAPLQVTEPERLSPQPGPPLAVDAEPVLRQASASEQTTAPMAEPRAMPVIKTARRKSPLQSVMLFISILLLALLGGAIYFYWQGGIPELTQWVDRLTGQTVAPQVKGKIRIEELNSFYVSNQEAGQLLVIQGKAFNDFPEPRSSLTVKGVLYSKEGKTVLQQTVFCGNPLTQEALQTLAYAKIEESMNNPFGESLSNLNVAPGKTLPFTIVFRNLPANIAEFTVEAVDSKPASKQ